MSFILTPAPYKVLSCAASYADLVPGQPYSITGLSQGTLASYSIIAIAVSPTKLSSNVIVIPVSPVSTVTFKGTFDYSTCLLTVLEDNLNNHVEGSAVIAVWPWTNTLWHDNFFGGGSTLTFTGGVATLTQFYQNYVSGLSAVSLADSANLQVKFTEVINVSTLNLATAPTGVLAMNYNFLDHGTINLSAAFPPAGGIIRENVIRQSSVLNYGRGGPLVTIDRNSLSELTSTLTFLATAATNVWVRANVLQAAASLLIPDTASFSSTCDIERNMIGNQSTMTISGIKLAAYSILENTIGNNSLFTLTSNEDNLTTLQRNVFGAVSSLTITGNSGAAAGIVMTNNVIHGIVSINKTGGTYIIQDNHVDSSSSLTLAGAANNQITKSFIKMNGRITNTVGGVVAEADIQSGTLNPAGFTATRVSLKDATSTLTANITDATKTGYVNALP